MRKAYLSLRPHVSKERHGLTDNTPPTDIRRFFLFPVPISCWINNVFTLMLIDGLNLSPSGCYTYRWSKFFIAFDMQRPSSESQLLDVCPYTRMQGFTVVKPFQEKVDKKTSHRPNFRVFFALWRQKMFSEFSLKYMHTQGFAHNLKTRWCDCSTENHQDLFLSLVQVQPMRLIRSKTLSPSLDMIYILVM